LNIGGDVSGDILHGYNGAIDELKLSYYSDMRIVYPGSDEIVYYERLSRIEWIGGITGENLDIRFSFDSGASWTAAADDTLNDGLYIWITPTITSSGCMLQLCDSDDNNIVYAQSEEFTIFQNCLLTDLTGDCQVDLDDLVILSNHWLEP
jgi:hypothetical protein